MRALGSIYRLTLRSIFRERVALSMLVLLGLVLFLLPRGLQTDGTIEGALRMHIRYSLGFTSVLVAGMCLWISCASIASDLTSKRLHMVLTKPVSRTAVWWGKWLAVMTLIGGLCLFCGGVTWLRIQGMLRAADLDPATFERVLRQQVTARKPIDAEVEDLMPQAEEMLERQREIGLPPELTEEQVLRNILQFLTFDRHAASAGESILWEFPVRRRLVAGELLQIFYEFDGSSIGLSEVPGRWILQTEDQDPLFSRGITQTPQGDHVLELDITEEMAAADRLWLRFENLSEEGDRVFFKPDRGVRLFLKGGGFTPNLFRAVLLILGLLGILAALGVSTGSFFSLPVACYVTSMLLVLQAFSGVVEEVLEEGPGNDDPGRSALVRGVDRVRFAVYRGVDAVLSPLQVEDPLGRVARGVRISPAEVLGSYGLRFIPIVLVISVAGVTLFNRREIGGAV